MSAPAKGNPPQNQTQPKPQDAAKKPAENDPKNQPPPKDANNKDPKKPDANSKDSNKDPKKAPAEVKIEEKKEIPPPQPENPEKKIKKTPKKPKKEQNIPAESPQKTQKRKKTEEENKSPEEEEPKQPQGLRTPVKVVVRSRPTANFASGNLEVKDGDKNVKVYLKKKTNAYIDNQQENYSFAFDNMLHNCSQENVYAYCANGVVDSIISGINATIVAYGQTGAGKTFTMTGSTEIFAQRGIIPRMLHELFTNIDQKSSERQFNVTMSYFEIYNETILDLLSETTYNELFTKSTAALHDGTMTSQQQQQQMENLWSDLSANGLQIMEEASGSTFVRGIRKVNVSNEEEAMAIMFEGETNRVICEHQLNKNSSRSHCVMTIYVESNSKTDPEAPMLHSKLNLVDLAGSERVSKTKATGNVLKEAMYINKSLSFLEQVVVALSDPERTHIPYRQSKLTHFLKDSLGGNSKTLMIANIWCEAEQLFETVSTLKFASRMMMVNNNVMVNQQISLDVQIKYLNQQIRELNQQVKDLKREIVLKDEKAAQEKLKREEEERKVREAEAAKESSKKGKPAPKPSTPPVAQPTTNAAAPAPNFEQLYGPYNEEQKKELRKEVDKFLNNEIEEVETVNFRKMKEIMTLMKTLAKEFQEKGMAQGKAEMQIVLDKEKEAFNKEKEKLVAAAGSGKAGAGGAAPAAGGNKPPTREGGAGRPAAGGKKDDKNKAPVEEKPPEPVSPLPEKKFLKKPEAYEVYKQADGKEMFAALLDSLKKQKDKNAEGINVTKKLNNVKKAIDDAKQAIDAKVQENNALLEKKQQAAQQNANIEDLEDELHEQKEYIDDLYQQITNLKEEYKKLHQSRLEVKHEVEYLQNFIDTSRLKMIKQFDVWYEKEFGPLGDTTSSPVMNGEEGAKKLESTEELTENEELDAGEKFEKLEKERIAREGVLSSYYNAKKTIEYLSHKRALMK